MLLVGFDVVVCHVLMSCAICCCCVQFDVCCGWLPLVLSLLASLVDVWHVVVVLACVVVVIVCCCCAATRYGL